MLMVRRCAVTVVAFFGLTCAWPELATMSQPMTEASCAAARTNFTEVASSEVLGDNLRFAEVRDEELAMEMSKRFKAGRLPFLVLDKKHPLEESHLVFRQPFEQPALRKFFVLDALPFVTPFDQHTRRHAMHRSAAVGTSVMLFLTPEVEVEWQKEALQLALDYKERAAVVAFEPANAEANRFVYQHFKVTDEKLPAVIIVDESDATGYPVCEAKAECSQDEIDAALQAHFEVKVKAFLQAQKARHGEL